MHGADSNLGIKRYRGRKIPDSVDDSHVFLAGICSRQPCLQAIAEDPKFGYAYEPMRQNQVFRIAILTGEKPRHLHLQAATDCLHLV
jgi:hypothetical protein